MKILTIFLIFVTLSLSCYLCSQVSDIPLIEAPAGITLQTQPTPKAPAGITLQTQPIPVATIAERTAFWLSFWNGVLVVTVLVLVGFLIWGAVVLLAPLADGLDRLVGVLDHFRKVMFKSQLNVIQVRKTDKLADIDVDVALAKFHHDRDKGQIALERIQDVTDIEVLDKADRFEMSKKYARLRFFSEKAAVKLKRGEVIA